MGSGVAKAIYEKWPAVREFYLACHREGKIGLGCIATMEVEKDILVINGYTQEYYGYDGKRYADPDAINKVLHLAVHWAKINNSPIYAPRLGSGLGGLDWESEVLPLFKDVARIYPDVDIIICEL